MNPSTKRAVAYIAGRASSGRSSSAVFEFSTSRYYNFSGKVTELAISAFDHTENCHIGGVGRLGMYSLHHFGSGKQIRLKIDGRKFTGFDFASGIYFSGNVSGRSVSVYDHGDSQWHRYTI
jgi:hypothetical protein